MVIFLLAVTTSSFLCVICSGNQHRAPSTHINTIEEGSNTAHLQQEQGSSFKHGGESLELGGFSPLPTDHTISVDQEHDSFISNQFSYSEAPKFTAMPRSSIYLPLHRVVSTEENEVESLKLNLPNASACPARSILIPEDISYGPSTNERNKSVIKILPTNEDSQNEIKGRKLHFAPLPGSRLKSAGRIGIKENIMLLLGKSTNESVVEEPVEKQPIDPNFVPIGILVRRTSSSSSETDIIYTEPILTQENDLSSNSCDDTVKEDDNSKEGCGFIDDYVDLIDQTMFDDVAEGTVDELNSVNKKQNALKMKSSMTKLLEAGRNLGLSKQYWSKPKNEPADNQRTNVTNCKQSVELPEHSGKSASSRKAKSSVQTPKHVVAIVGTPADSAGLAKQTNAISPTDKKRGLLSSLSSAKGKISQREVSSIPIKETPTTKSLSPTTLDRGTRTLKSTSTTRGTGTTKAKSPSPTTREKRTSKAKLQSPTTREERTTKTRSTSLTSRYKGDPSSKAQVKGATKNDKSIKLEKTKNTKSLFSTNSKTKIIRASKRLSRQKKKSVKSSVDQDLFSHLLGYDN